MERRSTYPSAFFTEEGKKPSITVRAIQGDFLDYERHFFWKVIMGEMEVEEAICYLWNVFQYIEGDLTEEWKSFRTVIGRKDTRISAQSLLTAVVQQDEPFVIPEDLEKRESVPDTWPDRFFIIHLLVCAFHIYSHPEFKHDQLFEKYKLKFDPIEFKIFPSDFVERPDKSSWVKSADYCKLVAALDMFLNRFPSHVLSDVRIGTKTARFQGCGALEYFQYLEEYTGEPLSTLNEKIWALQVTQDIERINKPGEERDDPYSYAPYFSSMRLGLRNPYSSNENGALHLLVHTIGSIKGYPRSLHASYPKDCNTWEPVINGYQIGYAASRARKGQLKIKPTHFLPKRLEEEVSRKLVAHRNLRENTVGHALKTRAEEFLRRHGIAVGTGGVKKDAVA